MDLPRYLTETTITVEPYTGSGPYGETYAAPVTSRAHVEYGRRLVLSTDGAEVTASARAWASLDIGPVPPRSRVTLPDGTVRPVIVSTRHEFGAMTPNHVTLAME